MLGRLVSFLSSRCRTRSRYRHLRLEVIVQITGENLRAASASGIRKCFYKSSRKAQATPAYSCRTSAASRETRTLISVPHFGFDTIEIVPRIRLTRSRMLNADQDLGLKSTGHGKSLE